MRRDCDFSMSVRVDDDGFYQFVARLPRTINLVEFMNIFENTYGKVNEDIQMDMDFSTELQHVLNKYSMEQGSNTPDYVLAAYLKRCLDNLNQTVTERNNYYQL